MKLLILAGGFGSRISEESTIKPKPMVDIGERPIIWHIMKTYSSFGINEFVILLGYKGYVIKEYFSNYFLHQSDVTFDLQKNSMHIHNSESEPWKVTLVNTGLETLTGGRIKRAKEYIGEDDFLLTYGDGLSNVDIDATIRFHKSHKKILTLTAVQPEGRYGSVNIDNKDSITKFDEKVIGDGRWINGGFFVCSPEVLSYIEGDETIFEEEPLKNLARDKQLMAYKHYGFWKCMDTLKDKNDLNQMWHDDLAPWKNW